MTDDIRAQAATTLAQIEAVTAVILPEPGGEVVALDQAPAAKAAEIRTRMDQLDMTNTQSIISFGSGAQAELQVISQAMLEGVKNKDAGPAGDSLRKIVTTIRGFGSEELDLRRERSWWKKSPARPPPLPNSWPGTRPCKARSTRSPKNCCCTRPRF